MDGEAQRRSNRRADAAVLGVAVLVAVLSARPYADSANDGSRLAAVEALVDQHTLAIDESVFVKVPPPHAPRQRQPYPFAALSNGTIDKIKVGDHFYSDKPYTLSLYLAGWYALLRSTGLDARERVDLFCWWMTLLSSGVAYVAAVWCVYRTGRTVGLATAQQVLLAGSFGLCTVTLPYAEHVNSHIVLLALAAGLIGFLARASHGEAASCWCLFGLGTLAGLGYAVEQGVGQLFWGWALVAVGWRWGLGRAASLFLVASLPWLALHHAVNYTIGGTFGPANAVPEYFDYPGSSFDASNLTGRWSHRNGWWFLGYAGGLLFSDRGFLTCNLPLWLLLPGIVVLVRSRKADGVAAFGAAWGLSTYLLYATLSSNFSGECLSIRWFVPLLAPAFYVVALLLRQFPQYRGDFILLSSWGLIEATVMAKSGMWQAQVPLFWPVVGTALATWLAYHLVRRRRTAARL